jgi:hypothetical protein
MTTTLTKVVRTSDDVFVSRTLYEFKADLGKDVKFCYVPATDIVLIKRTSQTNIDVCFLYCIHHNHADIWTKLDGDKTVTRIAQLSVESYAFYSLRDERIIDDNDFSRFIRKAKISDERPLLAYIIKSSLNSGIDKVYFVTPTIKETYEKCIRMTESRNFLIEIAITAPGQRLFEALNVASGDFNEYDENDHAPGGVTADLMIPQESNIPEYLSYNRLLKIKKQVFPDATDREERPLTLSDAVESIGINVLLDSLYPDDRVELEIDMMEDFFKKVTLTKFNNGSAMCAVTLQTPSHGKEVYDKIESSLGTDLFFLLEGTDI